MAVVPRWTHEYAATTMCGICGVIQVGGEPREVVRGDVLDRMTDRMFHRGPNDRGTYSAPGVALGVRRLSVVDVEGGHQPFANEDRSIWAMQNGEIYNHESIRRRLAGDHTFTSRCDTEILPHIYEEVGTAYPEHLRGKFGAVVWDARSRRAVIARDRLGVKPLYYAVVGDLLIFASELKSVIASELVSAELDWGALSSYLTFGLVPGPRTPLLGVKKLLPGQRIIVDEHGVGVEQYWSLPTPTPDYSLRFDETRERLLHLLDESIQLRLMSDVPLGAMLSGGLDSSLIVALMAPHVTGPVKTFSVGFTEAGSANELDDARQVAGLFGCDHHELEMSFADESIALEDLVWHLDEPLADLSAVGFVALSELAAQHVTVALSGQGADELFGGYSRHRNAALADSWERLPSVVRSAGEGIALRGPRRLRRAAGTLRAGSTDERLLKMKTNLSPQLYSQLAHGSLAGLEGEAAKTVGWMLDGLPTSALLRSLHLDTRLGLVDDMLHYFDRASMAYSLEVRVPFLDHELVEFAATIPPQWKVRGLRTKHILKEAARGLLPNSIIDKRKIGFFNPAVEAWFRAQGEGAIANYLLAQEPRYAAFLDPVVVRHMVKQHLDRTDTSHANLLLSILILEIWLSVFLPRAFGHDEAFRPPRDVRASVVIQE